MIFLILISLISCDKIIFKEYFTLNKKHLIKTIPNKEKILLSKINKYQFYWQFFFTENNFIYIFDIYIHTKFMYTNIFFIMDQRLILTKYKNNYQINDPKKNITSLNNKINNIIYDCRNYKFDNRNYKIFK